MISIKKKTYNDSYLYNLDANRHNQMLTDFIINADRVEKKSNDFVGILEDVRRVQRSNVLYTLLLNDDVVLGISKGDGLPRAFKVFMAKDIREGKGAKRKVFIDVTGLLVLKNGYYTCKNLGFFIAYLFQALCYFIYENDTLKVINNSIINKAGADAYSAMFGYIIDYLRIIGYEQSKTKITYLSAIFYLHTLLGKDIDQYVKNTAASIAGVSPSISNAWDIYYTEKDLIDIDSFITMISGTFRLKGLNTEVFVGKWSHAYTPSAIYACELFTSFAGVLAATYSGSYIVNQKQIERCCSKAMISFSTEILKIGAQVLGAAEMNREWALEYKDKNTIALRESILSKIPDEAKYEDEDFEHKDKAIKKTKSVIKWYLDNHKEKQLSAKIKLAVNIAVGTAGAWINEKDNYEIGVTEAILKVGAKYLNDSHRKYIKSDFNKQIAKYEKDIDKANSKGDKTKVKKLGQFKLELTKCLNLL